MKKIVIVLSLFAVGLYSCDDGEKSVSEKPFPTEVKMSYEKFVDKNKGGWAGQTVGCTYGGFTEFKYNGTMIRDYVPITWDEGRIKWFYENAPGLYDDVYMDAEFVLTFDRLGLDAPVDSFAVSFANAGYWLWHANQAARYNILNGIMPPESGHWKNNPHADDIDFQIEADFAGLMSPGMPNTAVEISDKIGHIMNYGDGWYGGVYVAAMYSLAYIYDDPEQIVGEALKTIPAESDYYKCISEVIANRKRYPDDWKRTWFEVERNWSSDKYCPDGVYVPFNIDATVNSAYVVIGLLYGQGDFFKTMDIATRCGQDSDCNPATAAGILGTMIGYSAIPQEYISALKLVEAENFSATSVSLNDLYRMSSNQALEVVKRNGGRAEDGEITIKCQEPKPARYEKSFDGIFPTQIIRSDKSIRVAEPVSFNGVGIVIKGEPKGKSDYVAEAEFSVDGNPVKTVKLPVEFLKRSNHELFWIYDLPKGNHTVTWKWLNPQPDADIYIQESIIYDK